MDPPPVPPPSVVRELPCKGILNRSTLGDYTLNCYTGCTHACVYCYARFMERFHPHVEAWGEYVDVKINAVEVLKRQLRRAAPGEVFVSSACDGWQPIEADYRLTRRCCELLLERDFALRILTKSALVRRDLELFRGHDVHLSVSLTTLDEQLARLWESQASSVAERWAVLEAARQVGLSTGIMVAPLLPFVSDRPAVLEALFQRAAAAGVERVLVDALNPRPRVWPALAELLRRHAPEQSPAYRRLLFDRPARAKYLATLRGHILEAAERAGLSARVTICFQESG